MVEEEGGGDGHHVRAVGASGAKAGESVDADDSVEELSGGAEHLEGVFEDVGELVGDGPCDERDDGGLPESGVPEEVEEKGEEPEADGQPFVSFAEGDEEDFERVWPSVDPTEDGLVGGLEGVHGSVGMILWGWLD